MRFGTTLFISFVGHMAIFVPLGFMAATPVGKEAGNVHVVYYQAKPQPDIRPDISKSAIVAKADTPSVPAAQKKVRAIPNAEDKARMADKIQKAKEKQAQALAQQNAKPVVTEENSQPESIPGTNMPNTPISVSYYNYIREAIRQSMEMEYKPVFGEGEVTVTFILNKNGQLLSLNIVDERSSNDPLLRRLSYLTLQKAAPFKSFPDGLELPRISFTIPIVFKKR